MHPLLAINTTTTDFGLLFVQDNLWDPVPSLQLDVSLPSGVPATTCRQFEISSLLNLS